MYKTLFCLFLGLGAQGLSQSKHDYVWVTGYGSFNGHFGGTQIDFNQGEPQFTHFELPHQFGFNMPCSISDENGHLQFYTNGCKIVNASHEIIENGEVFCSGYFQSIECDEPIYGYDAYQNMLILPRPGHRGQYVYFHPCLNEVDKNQVFYAEIDMNANNGRGKVIEKQQLLRDTALAQGAFAPVRHGNGRDWWIIIPREHHSIFDFYLLTPDSILGPFTRDMDDFASNMHSFTGWNTVVSPDGKLFARVTLTWLGNLRFNRIFLYDLDRCAGTLSNPRVITVLDPNAYASWAAISPNSRYMYFQMGQTKLYQFDLQAPDIEASRVLVGEYDGFTTPQGFSGKFHAMALAPNGKIYMCTTSGTYYYHTIHAPDEPGLACDFRQHDLELPTVAQNMMPLYPNFRLYDVPNALCDTLGINSPEFEGVNIDTECTFKLSPNPANNRVSISTRDPFTAARLRVFNAAGQKVYEYDLIEGTFSHVFYVDAWAPGIYWVSIEPSCSGRWTGKLIVGE